MVRIPFVQRSRNLTTIKAHISTSPPTTQRIEASFVSFQKAGVLVYFPERKGSYCKGHASKGLPIYRNGHLASQGRQTHTQPRTGCRSSLATTPTASARSVRGYLAEALSLSLSLCLSLSIYIHTHIRVCTYLQTYAILYPQLSFILASLIWAWILSYSLLQPWGSTQCPK